jgi:hypothetical protein
MIRILIESSYFIIEGQKRKGRPAKGDLFFQGRIVLTEQKPSKLSGEILWAEKAECQGIFGK